ncbi:hypothetical protein P152DRAFT_244862 [Eremomyces bilateralis CBS 781.70]|uniref:Transmembrane protein n=1 Tax=Eremomyces bilateralis CBS 781.70 TaxID=1392243 RepID=A0A6G1GAJ2_9PEZI|nr:uncharacterized protein P152DRAFT_244862 [Eremomyces bilateralis CBS 781.70]KAF1815085.1 hypothetical protein P152DRAFT_244862 [Eremomyces bilateralis CBS 781.70]
MRGGSAKRCPITPSPRDPAPKDAHMAFFLCSRFVYFVFRLLYFYLSCSIFALSLLPTYTFFNSPRVAQPRPGSRGSQCLYARQVAPFHFIRNVILHFSFPR